MWRCTLASPSKRSRIRALNARVRPRTPFKSHLELINVGTKADLYLDAWLSAALNRRAFQLSKLSVRRCVRSLASVIENNSFVSTIWVGGSSWESNCKSAFYINQVVDSTLRRNGRNGGFGAPVVQISVHVLNRKAARCRHLSLRHWCNARPLAPGNALRTNRSSKQGSACRSCTR
jgi:hypothetical protein